MIKLIAPALAALTLTAGAAPALDLQAMTDAERTAFREEVRAYLLDNPEVIMEAVRLLETRQNDAQAKTDLDLVAAHAQEIFEDGYSWVGGNPEGDITLVEFIDYRCGYCRKAAPEVSELIQRDGNIRLIVKEFPILGEASVLSSRFAVATRQTLGDAAYKQVHDALIDMSGKPDAVTLRRLAEALDLDADAIISHMDSDDVTREITRTRALAEKLQIRGTPSFILQDEMLRGYLPLDQMAAIVAEKRAAQ